MARIAFGDTGEACNNQEPIRSSATHHRHGGFAIEMLRIGSQVVRVGRTRGRARANPPLLLFNGIGGNIEMLAPLASALPEREVITFDVPGVGQSAMPKRPYRPRGIVRLACGILDHYGHEQVDVLGVSWGGAPAQQFARTEPRRCRRLILAATATGWLMVPARPRILLKMLTPRRYSNPSYAMAIAGDIYGGVFRHDPAAAHEHFKHVKWQSSLGYYLQIAALVGWTSIHWLRHIRQRSLVMAGADDPLVPLINARLMHCLIPDSEFKVLDCGHLFLLTRVAEASTAIRRFLDDERLA